MCTIIIIIITPSFIIISISISSIVSIFYYSNNALYAMEMSGCFLIFNLNFSWENHFKSVAWKHNGKHPGISYKTNNIFTDISRVLMNFRGRCHPDMLHSDHQQINKKSKRKQNGQNTFSK